MSSKRRISELLPEVLQTDILKKFFAATGDHLFQPEKVETINGYIGNRPNYTKRDDVYVKESSKSRLDYQVDPITVSRDSETNQVTRALFYDDLINKLRWQGALVGDQNRLFSADYYSFGLPIDLDKWLNYSSYVWVPEGPNRIVLLDTTDIRQIQSLATYEYTGDYLIEGDETIHTSTWSFSSGMKIRFAADIDLAVRNVDFLLENVGNRIRLVPESFKSYLAWENPSNFDSDVWDGNSESVIANYITIARGSENENPWSIGNRWFHKDVLAFSQTPVSLTMGRGATKPILEFDADIKLWNFGTKSRGQINLVDTKTTSLDQVVGKSSFLVKQSDSDPGVPLDDNMIVLFTNLSDAMDNNRFYKVTNLRNEKTIVLQLLANGDDTTGSPQSGDCVLILQGDSTAQNISTTYINSSWYYSDGIWKKGQSRQVGSYTTPTLADIAVINQSPLFELFDSSGNAFSGYYGNDFAGCTLVEYRKAALGVPDSVLGFVPEYEDITPTNYIFDVTQSTNQTYWLDGSNLSLIKGYAYYQTKNKISNAHEYLNNWYLCSQPSRQYVVNEFWGNGEQKTFQVDQPPDLEAPMPPSITVEVGSTRLVKDVGFTVSGNQVSFINPPTNDTLIKIRTWGGTTNQASKGYFEIPVNLQANPNNHEITSFSRASLTAHVESVIFNQAQFSGTTIGLNNWRDSSKDQGLGTCILQHRAPLLKLMGLNAAPQSEAFSGNNTVLDPFMAIQWAQSEYLRFYNKIINSLVALYNNGGLTGSDSPQQWLSEALNRVNVGKTKSNAWANSGFDLSAGLYCSQQSSNPTWVPPSATRLGATPAYIPTAYFDQSQPGNPLSLRCHNGAVVVLKDLNGNSLGTIESGATQTTDPTKLTHPVSRAWLLFEQQMFVSLPATYSDSERNMPVDYRTVFSGKYRATSYTRNDHLKLLSPAFQRWCTFNQIDAFKNTSFVITDPFSWNYRGCVDRDGEMVPGHWRGIYFWFFDTDQPHLAPWEMLGFSQMPSWWNSEYGASPYTSGNLKMWRDLQQGKIARGSRAGIWPEWSRPGLLNNIPVDSVGGLRAPFEAGVVSSLPSITEASQDWQWGDRSPIENVWLTTVDSDFTQASMTYLSVPAKFIEYLWDGTRTINLFPTQSYSQIVSTDTLKRKSSADYYVHRENPQDVASLPAGDSSYYGSCGIQHWISEKLISEGLNVTRYFGNIIRGLGPCLGHKMGGFTNNDSLRLLVDSFGLTDQSVTAGRKDSLILPQEDSVIELLRSPSVSEFVYTGVIIEYKGDPGWRVIGYDSVNPYFSIIPSDTKGPKNTVVQDNQRVIEYSTGTGKVGTVAYGTVFRTRQEVYDFLISLGRYQQSQGWIFDQFDESTNRMRDWSLSAREFLFWSQGPWATGTYIQLSPLATLAKFTTEFGLVQNVGSMINGAYSILDKSGITINLNNIDFLRMDSDISVKPLNEQGIYGLRLSTSSIEHAILFNNFTIFGDTLYDPLFNLRQSRFRVFGLRTLDWNGRLEAPGYMVTQSVTTVGTRSVIKNSIVPNLEKSVEDLRQLFEYNLTTPYQQVSQPGQIVSSEVTQSLPTSESNLAKHLIGYQQRPYLTNLLIDNNVAYQFYQGMIQEKGTDQSILKLLRNTNIVTLDQDLFIYEEFGLRSSIYGATSQIFSMDVTLVSDQVKTNPQQVVLLGAESSDSPRDQIITILPRDTRKINFTPETPPFRLRTHLGADIEDLPTAGYVLPEEVNWTVTTDADLQNLYARQSDAFVSGTGELLSVNDYVWQMIDSARTWNIWKIVKPSWTLSYTVPSIYNELQTDITTSDVHGLSVGDRVIIFGIQGTGVVWDNTYTVVSATESTFTINIQTRNVGSGGTIWIYRSIRFSNNVERDIAYDLGTVAHQDLVYVDGDINNPWVVYKRGLTQWISYRIENYKVDSRYIIGSRLYNQKYLNTLAILSYYDPVKNKIPGIFDREISFKTPYDPAHYTVDNTGIYGTAQGDAWGNDQVGVVWWDLSTTRFMDYEIGTNSYRRQHWGAIAPGTSIDIYEWVRSPVPPASWKNLVAQGTDLSGIGSTNLPSGEIKSSDAPYVVRQQQNNNGDLVTVYYFWVKNATTVPDIAGRNISINVLSNIIINPSNNNLSWWSPIDTTTAIIGNIGGYLNGSQTVWQVNWCSSLDLGNSHKEWMLVRPNDTASSISNTLWDKMSNSLVEFNSQGVSVPDLRLPDMQKYGLLIRPSQTLFEDSSGARQAFVTTVNEFLKTSTSPPENDTERTNWLNYFSSSESPPPSIYEIPNVRLATIPGTVAKHVGQSQATTLIEIQQNSSTSRIQIGWWVSGAGITVFAQVVDITIQVSTIIVSIDPNSTSFITQGESYYFTPWPTIYDYGDTGDDSKIISFTTGALIIDGSSVNENDRILVKDQPNAGENGIYTVIQIGDASTPAILTRATDFNQVSQNLYLAQLTIQEGETNQQSYFYQSNQNILRMGIDPMIWTSGKPASNWVRQVPDFTSLNALNYQLTFGSRVLVHDTEISNSIWSIWEWTKPGSWELTQAQSYQTQTCWDYCDWYLDGYSDLTVIDLVFETLADRDAYLDFINNQIVKVLNTGSGYWGLYLRENDSWILVGLQNGGIELSDRLYDYEKYQMGFDGGGFDSDGQGFEYDSRLELNQIIAGLWDPAGTGGLLLQNNSVNQPNQLFFTMLNKSLSEQQFIDYAFKTSFLTIKGFTEVLEATPYYTTNKIDSLIDYVNELKPYHSKIRKFVDNRKASDQFNSYSTDFDKPPYVDPNIGVRILDPNNVADQSLLQSLDAYKFWYDNYQTNPDQIRSIRTRMIYNRVSCNQSNWYAAGYSEETIPDVTVASMVDLYLLSNTEPGTIVFVTKDDFDRWSMYVRNTTEWNNSQPGLAWNIVGYQHNMGAIDSIIDNYHPTPGMPAVNSPLLISGCAGSLTTLEGSQFNSEDSWDQTVWDNIRGWSYTVDAQDQYDQYISGGVAPKYFTFSGDNSTTEFTLPWAPQDPNRLKIWVGGTIKNNGTDWSIRNSTNTALIASKGLGYQVNDVLTFEGGISLVPAAVKVIDIDPVGAIIGLEIINPGSYTVVPPTPIVLLGGAGINATGSARWTGSTIKFTQAPGNPTKGPNIWVVENGSTFNPGVSSVLDTVFDGRGLNQPHLEAGHPEELGIIRTRNSLILDVYTHPSSGYGEVISKTYQCDGVTDQFDIGQIIIANSQLFVYHNGILLDYSVDYVINTEYMRAVFITPPLSGSLSIISIGSGGTTKGLGYWSIMDPGRDYVLFDDILMTGGDSSSVYPKLQITAVTGVDITITAGGENYKVGDQLLYKYGQSLESLTIRVLAVSSQGGYRGIITAAEIVTGGYYTNLTAGVSEWYTSGSGTGAVIVPAWGIANLFAVDRGVYFNEPTMLTQNYVIHDGVPGGSGTGVILLYGAGAIREEHKLQGNGIENTIVLSSPTISNTVLVTWNGEIYTNYGFDSASPNVIVLDQSPAVDDVVYAIVYNSLSQDSYPRFSLTHRETVVFQAGTFTYTLTTPPSYSPIQTKNVMVWWNNRKMKPPVIRSYKADGIQTTFAIGYVPTNDSDITVWINTQPLPITSYTIIGSDIVFPSAVAADSTVTIQYADTTLENYEYLVEGSSIIFGSWVPFTEADEITVVVFTEDSSTSFVTDRWAGASSGIYQLSQTPSNYGSVQVFVDGILADQGLDYVIAQNQNSTEIRFGDPSTHLPGVVVEAYYPTALSAKPAVALRLFTNIYDQTIAQRLSNEYSTRLVAPLLLDSSTIQVSDGGAVADATELQPGAIWVGSERIEYTSKIITGANSVAELSGLRRGTLGTPNGVSSIYTRLTYNGDASTRLFLGNSLTPIVLVNDVEQILGVDYTISINPTGQIDGVYVEFFQGRAPVFGNANVIILNKTQDQLTTTICFPTGTVVRDASANQNIPGGYVWPYGNKGLQYSSEPETPFLLKAPGARMV